MQYGLGLMVPGANLQRALFIGMNSFDVLCGPYGDADVSNPFQYVLYGGVYANLLIQIIFLIIVLTICEYQSADWLRRHIWQRKLPARLHYVVETGEQVEPSAAFEETSKAANEASRSMRTPILSVSQISKFFGPVFAVENVSFDIAANETLVLLGGNGAGKTTIINMIRGELNPDFGDIYIDGISVRRQPHKARIQMGVCPQDDAIDNLTVRQTLNFYAAVKGLRNIVGNVDRVIDALNISLYQNVVAKNLSGGTRRKLSIAIALLGIQSYSRFSVVFTDLNRESPHSPPRRAVNRPRRWCETNLMASPTENQRQPRNPPYDAQYGRS